MSAGWGVEWRGEVMVVPVVGQARYTGLVENGVLLNIVRVRICMTAGLCSAMGGAVMGRQKNRVCAE